jgi:SAM-dependent methyltransferase
MTNADSLFVGSIPQLYDQLMVPMIFEPYAEDISNRVSAFSPQDILEIAAGTGAVTRALAKRLGPNVRVTATDLNQPMLDLSAASLAGDQRFAFAQADAQDLPFEDASFDTVMCQFGVMFFPDQRRAFDEAFRVLRPKGHYVFNVWGSLQENAFVHSIASTLTTEFPDNPPVFMQRTPHGFHDTRPLVALLEAVGFSVTDVSTLDHLSKAATPMDAAMGYCQGSPLRAEILARDPEGLGRITSLVAAGLERDFGQGPITGDIRAHVVTAIRT